MYCTHDFSFVFPFSRILIFAFMVVNISFARYSVKKEP